MKKKVKFEWTNATAVAFLDLKAKLCKAPVLAYPKFDKDFVLETDASQEGVGAVLSQTQADGCVHPVEFASRSMSPAERNYGVTVLETLCGPLATSTPMFMVKP